MSGSLFNLLLLSICVNGILDLRQYSKDLLNIFTYRCEDVSVCKC